MARKKSSNTLNNLPRPNIMWFWAALVFLIIGYSVYAGDDGVPVRSDWNTVSGMIAEGEVDKIVVVNRESAEVYLKDAAVKRYRSDKQDKRMSRMPEHGAQIVFTIGSVDSFRED
ncbi:MAG: peptidase M41, partial [Alistipes sp.]|nr:peptidase M41 [Alistipes sp.]